MNIGFITEFALTFAWLIPCLGTMNLTSLLPADQAIIDAKRQSLGL